MMKKYMMYYIDIAKDFQMEEVRICDCSLEPVLNFLKKHRGLSGANVMRSGFNKITSHANCSKNEVVYSLLSSASVVSCKNTLYQSDDLNFVSKTQLSRKCQSVLPIMDELRSCILYIDDDFENFNKLCFNCKVNFLQSVSARFHRFTF